MSAKGIISSLAIAIVLYSSIVWGSTVISTEQIEADWLRQDELRKLGKRPKPASANNPNLASTVKEDAIGGCDGQINGRWGFHTAMEMNPWWQVDLGTSKKLARVLLWNRCDGNMANRTSRVILLVSDDGKKFFQASISLWSGRQEI